MVVLWGLREVEDAGGHVHAVSCYSGRVVCPDDAQGVMGPEILAGWVQELSDYNNKIIIITTCVTTPSPVLQLQASRCITYAS